MSSLQLTRRQALLGVALLLLVLAVAGRTLAGAGASAPLPQATLVAERPAEAARLVVHVAGAVRRPGLYRLREGR